MEITPKIGTERDGSQVPMSHPYHRNSAWTKEEKLQAERKKLEEHRPMSTFATAPLEMLETRRVCPGEAFGNCPQGRSPPQSSGQG